MNVKTLEIALDNSVRHTCYYVLNKDVNVCGYNDRFFEGIEFEGRRVTPLKEAKIWAKKNGYTFLEVVKIKNGQIKKYTL